MFRQKENSSTIFRRPKIGEKQMPPNSHVTTPLGTDIKLPQTLPTRTISTLHLLYFLTNCLKKEKATELEKQNVAMPVPKHCAVTFLARTKTSTTSALINDRITFGLSVLFVVELGARPRRMDRRTDGPNPYCGLFYRTVN